MAKGWHNKQVSTKWGVAILGVLLVSVIVLIPFLNQKQDLRSHAMLKNEKGGRVPKISTCTKDGCECGRYKNVACGGGMQCCGRKNQATACSDGTFACNKDVYTCTSDYKSINGNCHKP